MMNKLFLYIVFAIIFSGCSKTDIPMRLYITGTVDGQAVHDHMDKPVMVLVVKMDAVEEIISNDPELLNLNFSDLGDRLDDLIEYYSIIEYGFVDKRDLSFCINLSNTEFNVGDEIFIAAFLDSNNNGGVPFPDEGDFIGLYMDASFITEPYRLKSGENGGYNITIDQEIFEVDAVISGTVTGPETGRVFIVAYSGEVTAFPDSLDRIDTKGVVGVQMITKTGESADYSMPVLPFRKNFPIHNVLVGALVDTNDNFRPDKGDVIGFHQDENFFPSMLTATDGTVANVDIQLIATFPGVPEPSGYNVPLSGRIEIPGIEDYHDSDALFLTVFKINNLESLMDDLLNSYEYLLNITYPQPVELRKLLDNMIGSFQYFVKIESPPVQEQGAYFVDFNLDLSNTDLKAGDEIMMAAFWDRDYNGVIPIPTQGDQMGFYYNHDTYAFTLKLMDQGKNIVPEGNGNEFRLSRTWHEHNSSIKFHFTEGQLAGKYNIGDRIFVAAVQKNIIDVELPLYNSSIDLDCLVGATFIEIDSQTFADTPRYYEIDVLPLLSEKLIEGADFSINKVSLFAVHDTDGNGMPSEGDSLGYFNRFAIPSYFDITDDVNTPDGSIRFTTFVIPDNMIPDFFQ